MNGFLDNLDNLFIILFALILKIVTIVSIFMPIHYVGYRHRRKSGLQFVAGILITISFFLGFLYDSDPIFFYTLHPLLFAIGIACLIGTLKRQPEKEKPKKKIDDEENVPPLEEVREFVPVEEETGLNSEIKICNK